MPDTFSNLRLTKLDVGHNRLERFPFAVLNSANLEELYIDNNRISALPELLPNLKSLGVFYFDGNSIGRESESVRRMVKAMQKRGVEVKW